MALSNIFNEPRREIIETLVGAVAFFGGMWLWVYLAVWWLGDWKHPGGAPYPVAVAFVMLAVAVAVVVMCVVLIVVHAIGDGICEILAEHGVHLRPRRRY